MRPRIGLLLSALAVLALGACGDDASESPGPTTDSGATGPDPTVPDPAEPPDPATTELTLVDVGLDLVEPIDLVAVPDSDAMFVAERGGRIVEVAPDGEGLREVGTVIDLSDDVGTTDAERGLLGLAVDDAGEHLYASYTLGQDGSSQLDEFDLSDGTDGWRASIDSRRSLLRVDQPFGNHNGGHVAVGPDGALYLGLGDGGAAGDPDGRAQDPGTLLGKMVRIDPTEDDPEPEAWAIGLRNPWRFSFDPATDDLWIADVGQDRFEEINRLPGDQEWGRGANLGWDLFEGFEPFDDPSPHPETRDDPLTDPVFAYGHDQGCSVTGGVVYRGDQLPQLEGLYLFGDFCDPELRALRTAEDGAVEQLRLGVEHPTLVGFARRGDGEVFLISLDAGISRLAPA